MNDIYITYNPDRIPDWVVQINNKWEEKRPAAKVIDPDDLFKYDDVRYFDAWLTAGHVHNPNKKVYVNDVTKKDLETMMESCAKINHDILKGEPKMAKSEARIRYEEKCNEAKRVYDETIRLAEEELNAAEQRKKCDDGANMVKDLYDSYILAGFSEEQAMKFVTIALEKGK